MASNYHIGINLNIVGPFERDYAVLKGILAYLKSQKSLTDEAFKFPPRHNDMRPFDGFIGHSSKEQLLSLGHAPVPIVGLLDTSDSPKVVLDRRATGEMMAHHFISRGIKRMGYIGFAFGKNNISSEMQFEGMNAIAEEFGYP